jgi:hypothetical protein
VPTARSSLGGDHPRQERVCRGGLLEEKPRVIPAAEVSLLRGRKVRRKGTCDGAGSPSWPAGGVKQPERMAGERAREQRPFGAERASVSCCVPASRCGTLPIQPGLLQGRSRRLGDHRRISMGRGSSAFSGVVAERSFDEAR